MNKLNKWRIAGIFVIIILGTLMHYVYTWTGNSKIFGFFVPVNESVWEHLKLGYWSLVIFSLVEYVQLKSRIHNYYLAKLLGIIALQTTIIIFYYTYTSLAGKNIFYLDILAYILGVIICQYLSHLIFRTNPFSPTLNRMSLVGLIAIGLLFGITTYHPPHLPIFMDQKSKTYGINLEK